MKNNSNLLQKCKFKYGYIEYSYNDKWAYLYGIEVNVPNGASGHFKDTCIPTSIRLNTEENQDTSVIMFTVDDICITYGEIFIPILKDLYSKLSDEYEKQTINKRILQMS
jgi:hypothetical protein